MSFLPINLKVPHLNRQHRLRWGLLFLGLFSAASAQMPSSLDWDAAFADHSGNAPLHFVAQYQDARGNHRLEEWRDGLAHLRRRTDTRIDLHADATSKVIPGQAVDYLWQIVDLDKKIDNRISSKAMFQTGMLYSYWSMAHVLSRPAGRVTITQLEAPIATPSIGQPCTWYRIAPDAQPATRVCWSSTLAIPLIIQGQGHDGTWTTTFTVQSIDRKPLNSVVFYLDTKSLQVRNLDQIIDDD